MAFPTIFGVTPLFRALLWSLALHGLLLWPAPMLVSLPGVQRGGDALQARLRRVTGTAAMPTEGVPKLKDTTEAAAAVTERKSTQVPTRAAAAPDATSDQRESRVAAELGMDADGLRAYRVALAVQARQYWRYPEEALRTGLSGTSFVRVSLLSGGGMLVGLEKSSGRDSLDQAALEMLRAAVRSTSVPDSLREHSFSLVVPVVFEMPTGAAR